MLPRSKWYKTESIAIDAFKVQIDKLAILKGNTMDVPKSRLVCYLVETGCHVG